MAVWRLQVNTGGANVADCLQNHVAALWAGKVLAMERLRYDFEVIALFQKQQCCLSNKATTMCRQAGRKAR